MPDKIQRALQLGLLLSLVVGLLLTWRTGLLSDLSVDQIRRLVSEAGGLGPLVL